MRQLSGRCMLALRKGGTLMATARETLRQLSDALPDRVVEELVAIAMTLRHQALAEEVEEAMDDEEAAIVRDALADPYPHADFTPDEAKAYLASRRKSRSI